MICTGSRSATLNRPVMGATRVKLTPIKLSAQSVSATPSSATNGLEPWTGALRSSRQAQRLTGRRLPLVDHFCVVILCKKLGDKGLSRLADRGQRVPDGDIRPTTRLGARHINQPDI